MTAATPPQTIAVLGAGTMGAGIAQLACLSGARTLLYDPAGEALAAGIDRVSRAFARGVERRRLSPEASAAALERLYGAADLAAIAGAELVIEAVPEHLEVKQALFRQLSTEIVRPECVLATNTSSLLVTAIAAAAAHPERVVGMHFFNPAPVMALLEVVAGMRSSPEALAVARAAGEAMGKVVIDAADGPGFLVNRCNRPFGLEALRLLSERIASVEQIDRICRRGGGFRMGPFEVMDLVGIDVGFDVARSFHEQSFGEPRWRPSPLVARMVAAGRLGRKSGEGWYDYRSERPRPQDRDDRPTEGGRGDGLIVIAGESQLAVELGTAAAAAGWEVADPETAAGAIPFLILDVSGGETGGAPLQGAPQAICCATGSLAALDPGGSAIGFNLLPPLSDSACVELTRGPDSAASAVSAATHFFATLGKQPEWVGDGPGLVLGRIVATVVNECAFALGEGIGSAGDIDMGMRHGLNYPRGPLAWADRIGLEEVLGMIEGLYTERREERYRPAPVLQALVLSGRTGIAAGEGFFGHDS